MSIQAMIAVGAAATPKCPVCRSENHELFVSHAAGDCVRCRDCRLVWLTSPIDKPKLQELYADSQIAVAYNSKKSASRLRRSIGRIRQIRGLLKRDSNGLKFLDVGSNDGSICEAACRAGFDVTGVEPDKSLFRAACLQYPGPHYINAFLEHAALDVGYFDVVYCSEVIEHSADCQVFIATIAQSMRAGGLLYMTTPDISHWRRPRRIELWDGFKPPIHCLYFSPNNLKQLLAQHGLQVIKRRMAFKPGIKLIARKQEHVAGCRLTSDRIEGERDGL